MQAKYKQDHFQIFKIIHDIVCCRQNISLHIVAMLKSGLLPL